ncbi:hypothetical protein, partial [Streptomyces flavofungini]|uniref:hypothetical protein n=1 Tax=Streptomyces flavofungini TaxID=68200 RepID=UPI0034DEA1A9
ALWPPSLLLLFCRADLVCPWVGDLASSLAQEWLVELVERWVEHSVDQGTSADCCVFTSAGQQTSTAGEPHVACGNNDLNPNFTRIGQDL